MKDVAGNSSAIEAVLIALKQDDKGVRDWAVKLAPLLEQRREVLQALKQVSVEKINSFAQKPESSEIFILVLICSNMRLRINSMIVWESSNINCAAKTICIKFRFCVFMPVSTILWVR